jgi:hypothetical protein
MPLLISSSKPSIFVTVIAWRRSGQRNQPCSPPWGHAGFEQKQLRGRNGDEMANNGFAERVDVDFHFIGFDISHLVLKFAPSIDGTFI